jgi:alpha-N-arabinofuranosidase
MLLAEQLGAEAVWVINNGVSHGQDIPTKDIQPWMDAALESIEFVTGECGRRRGTGC